MLGQIFLTLKLEDVKIALDLPNGIIYICVNIDVGADFFNLKEKEEKNEKNKTRIR